MAKFLTTSGVSYYIENIISKAKQELMLISPYLKISKTLFERLTQANKRGVKITLVYGKAELDTQQLDLLNSIENLEVFYFDNLHAKCYLNEDEIVITSMNLHHYSEKNNREMGVFASKQEDHLIYEEAFAEVKEIIECAEVKKKIKYSIDKKEKIIEKINDNISSENGLKKYINSPFETYIETRYPGQKYKKRIGNFELQLYNWSLKVEADFIYKGYTQLSFIISKYNYNEKEKVRQDLLNLVSEINNNISPLRVIMKDMAINLDLKDERISYWRQHSFDYNDDESNKLIFDTIDKISSFLLPKVLEITEKYKY
jgi:hypothetical protein